MVEIYISFESNMFDFYDHMVSVTDITQKRHNLFNFTSNKNIKLPRVLVQACTLYPFLARLLILIKKGGLLQLKFGVVGVGVGVNIYLWAR